MSKKCSCPICICTCSFACRTSDCPKLLATKRQPPSAVKKSSYSSDACTAVLGNIMSNAILYSSLKDLSTL